MKYYGVVPFCIVLFSGNILPAADNAKLATVSPEKIPQLSTLNQQDRMALLEALDQQRTNLEGNLITQLTSATSKEVRFSAAFLLGQYHMEQAILSLSNFITLKNDDKSPQSRTPLWGRFPIVDALINIGLPSVPFMIDNLATSDDEKVRNLSASVIRYVYRDLDIDKLVLQKAITKQPDPAKKQRLQAALKYFGADPIPLPEDEPKQPVKQ